MSAGGRSSYGLSLHGFRKRRRTPSPECAAEMCDVTRSYSQSRAVLLSLSQADCAIIPAMANEQPKSPPEGKFAETLRKSREKRADMKEQSENRAQAKEEFLQREDAKRVDPTFTNTTDSES